MPAPPVQPPTRQSPRFLSRIQHMTFAWFTSSMSLSGMSNMLMARIIDWDPLYWIGFAGFCIGTVYFLFLMALQCVRYTFTPATFRYTVSHPVECCFIPTAMLAAATVIEGWFTVAQDFSVKGIIVDEGWQVLFRVWYWMYLVLSLLCSCMCYANMFANAEQNLQRMNPAWVLPIFPVMLCGSVASSVLETQQGTPAIAIAVSGLTMQGVGYTVSVMMYSVLFLRLMNHGFPAPSATPGLFMCVGPPSFTIICFLGIASRAKAIFGSRIPFVDNNTALSYDILYTLATMASIFLWAVSAWFFLISISAILHTLVNKELRSSVQFVLPWWACVFPNTGFAIATNYIAEALGSPAVRRFSAAIIIYLLVVFVGVASAHVRAVYKGQIMNQGQDEDSLIDTMKHRYKDLEKGSMQGANPATSANDGAESDGNRAGSQSTPPTYTNTPAISMYQEDINSSVKQAERNSSQHAHISDDIVVETPSSSTVSSSRQAALITSRPRLMTYGSNNEPSWGDDQMRSLTTTICTT